MGRSSLLVIILMTTVFAGTLLTLYNHMVEFPSVMVRNQLYLETENASDFTLRNAIRNANSIEFLKKFLGSDFSFEDNPTFTQVFNNYHIGTCRVDSVCYSFYNSPTNFMVKCYLTGSLHGQKVSKTAEMAFNYPLSALGKKPNVIYLEMEQLLLFPWLYELLGSSNDKLPDTSGNDYTGVYEGFTLISSTVPWGGAFSRYCTKFNGINNYIQVAPKATNDSINTDSSFSLMCFAKMDKQGRYGHETEMGTLMWVPSNPSDATLRNKPSAGIWFVPNSSSSASGTMHFAVTQNDASKTMLEVTAPYTRTADIFWFLLDIPFYTGHLEYEWNSFGLTYHNGVLKGYINGALVGTSAGTNVRAYPSTYGMSIGRKDLRGGSFSSSDYRYFCGVMDQIGMEDKALAPSEMLSWHNGVLSPAKIFYVKD